MATEFQVNCNRFQKFGQKLPIRRIDNVLKITRLMKKSKPSSAALSAKRKRRPKNATITIDDIAAAAGVSIATVSRFFNSPGMLKPKTAQLVRAAVNERGYV